MWIWLYYHLHTAQHRRIIHLNAEKTEEILTII